MNQVEQVTQSEEPTVRQEVRTPDRATNICLGCLRNGRGWCNRRGGYCHVPRWQIQRGSRSWRS